MAGRTGNYFVTIFNEAKRYVANLLQEGVPLVDGDWNDQSENMQKQTQRPFWAMGKRFVGQSWLVLGQGITHTSQNNIYFEGLGGSIGDPETWARGWIGGLQAILTADRLYWNDDGFGGGFVPYTAQHLDEMFHRSFTFAFVGGNIYRLTDTSMAFKPGELVGRTLYPNLQDASGVGSTPAGYTITANTANTIDMDVTTGPVSPPPAAAGDYYMLGLSTPGAPRDDEVYLDVHLEEWNKVEDPDLNMPIGPGIECMRRLKVVQCVHIIEDIVTHGSMPSDYVDADGNQHFTVLLASLARTANPNISPSMVTDDRDPWHGSGPEITVARGLFDQLENRIYRTYDPGTGLPVIDGVIMADGTLNPLAIGTSINHTDLKDMPDTGGVNTDHDGRYGGLTFSGETPSAPAGNRVLADGDSHAEALKALDTIVPLVHSDVSDMPDVAGVVTDHDGRYGDLTYSTQVPSAPSGGNRVVADADSHAKAIKALDTEAARVDDKSRANFLSAFDYIFGLGAATTVISTPTALAPGVKKIEYDNLTIQNGGSLTADGPWLHIAVKGTLNIQTGGRILLNGADGGDGAGGIGGVGGIGKGGDGGDGGDNTAGFTWQRVGKPGDNAGAPFANPGGRSTFGAGYIGFGGEAHGWPFALSGGGGGGGGAGASVGSGGAGGGGAGGNGASGHGLDGTPSLGVKFNSWPIFTGINGQCATSTKFTCSNFAATPIKRGDILIIIGGANFGVYTIKWVLDAGNFDIEETFPSTGSSGEYFAIMAKHYGRFGGIDLTELKGLHDFISNGGHLGWGGGGGGGGAGGNLAGGGGGAGGGAIYIEAKNTIFGTGYIVTGTDGSCTSGSATFTSAGSTFQTSGVRKGDILEIANAGPGYINNGKFRIIKVVNETTLELEFNMKTTTTSTDTFSIIPMHIDVSGGHGGAGQVASDGGAGGGGGGSVFIVTDNPTNVALERVCTKGGLKGRYFTPGVNFTGGYGAHGEKVLLDLSQFDG